VIEARIMNPLKTSLLALPLAFTLACSSGKGDTHSPTPIVTEVSPAVWDAGLPARPQADASVRGPIPSATTQLVVTLTEGWTGTDSTLLRFERVPGGSWESVGEPIASVIGHGGLGWGRGLHTGGAQPDEPVKREGDGRSPAGVFAIGGVYGYDKEFSGTTTLPYQQVDRKWRCVNDSASTHYNRVLDSEGIEKDWKEAEQMRRRDELYRLVVPIDHNAILGGKPEAEAGSCIFLHVWRRAGKPTIGCTAMPHDKLEGLASWLDTPAKPVLVALPRERYEALRASWQLPVVK
jgi:D-alanyl-D-alanine dipeptidase